MDPSGEYNGGRATGGGDPNSELVIPDLPGVEPVWAVRCPGGPLVATAIVLGEVGVTFPAEPLLGVALDDLCSSCSGMVGGGEMVS